MHHVWRMLNDALDMTQPYTDARREVNIAQGLLRGINTQLGSDPKRMLDEGRRKGWTRKEIIAAELRI